MVVSFSMSWKDNHAQAVKRISPRFLCFSPFVSLSLSLLLSPSIPPSLPPSFSLLCAGKSYVWESLRVSETAFGSFVVFLSHDTPIFLATCLRLKAFSTCTKYSAICRVRSHSTQRLTRAMLKGPYQKDPRKTHRLGRVQIIRFCF